MNSSSNLDKRDIAVSRSRRSARVADASRSKRPAHRSSNPTSNNTKGRALTANSADSASTSHSPFTFSSAANGSWVDDKDELRRIELLRRLNQISQQKSQLERHASAAVSLDADTNPASFDAEAKRCGRGMEQTSTSHRSRLDTATDSNNPHPRRTRFKDAPRTTGAERSTGKHSRDVVALRTRDDPMQLDIGPASGHQSPTTSTKAETIEIVPSAPNLHLDSPIRKESAIGKLDLMLNDANKLPASPAHSRGSTRVRTPSVLVASQPGELPTNSATAYKNQQLSYCLRVVKDMLRLKDAFGFSRPIDRLWSRDQLPGYFEMITTPMDLSTVKHRLEAGSYLTPTPDGGPMDATFDAEAFGNDMRLIFNNAKTYNRPGDTFHEAATRLLEKFENKFKQMPTLMDITAELSKKSKKRKKSGSSSAAERRKNPESSRRKKPASTKKGKADTAENTGGAARKGGAKAKKSNQPKNTGEKSAPKTPEVRQARKPYEEMSLGEINSRLRLLEVRMNNRASSPAGASVYAAQAEALYDVTMTYEEKVLLSENVGKLPPDKLQKLVALASKDKNSSMEVNNNEEIELDIDGMNNETLRDMEAFVNHTLFNRRGGSGPNADIAGMSRDELKEEFAKLSSHFKKRKNIASGKKANGAGHGSTDQGKKSLYESDSSSDSNDSSGSSDEESSSDDDSDSSADEVSPEGMQKRRERNLAHQQAMKAAGTPLQSPGYK